MSKFINLCEYIEYFVRKEYSKNARFAVPKAVLVTMQILCNVRLYRRVNNSCYVSKVSISFNFTYKQYTTTTMKALALRPFRTPLTSRPTTLRHIPKYSNLHHYKKVTAGHLLPFQVSLLFHHKQTQDDDTLAHIRVVTSISLQRVSRCDGLVMRKVVAITGH